MDTRKVTFIATIAAIVLVAVGIGYAYTAMTTNQGNQAAPEYITLTQSGDGAYTFTTEAKHTVYWDSDDWKDVSGENPYKTNYKLSATKTTINGEKAAEAARVVYTVVKVGEDITLNAVQTNGNAKANVTCTLPTDKVIFAKPASINTVEIAVILKVSVTNGATEYFKLTSDNTFSKLKAGEGDTFIWDTSDHSFTIPGVASSTNYETATISVYYGYPGTNGITYERASSTPAPAGPSATPFTGAKLVFSIETSGSNPE